MGHLGLTPQSVNALSGFRVQGRREDDAARIVEDARRLEALGCFSIVLECVPSALGARITSALTVPTIGVGAGIHCDGQVLVLQDLLGLTGGHRPKFVRTYLDGNAAVRDAIDRFDHDVKQGDFPHGGRELRRMNIVEGVADLLEHRRSRGAGETGFVPTLGALHEGHLSLVRRAKAENARAWASIFVNPAQFNDRRRPRALSTHASEQDLALLEGAGCDLVFLPRADEVYRDGYRYRVTENALSLELEGASRPGHFDGVLTVVLKLLLLTRPERAYFGEKDFQQLQLIEGLVHAFFLDTRIVRCPTVREPDGLAMSSRNRLLVAGRARARARAVSRACRSVADRKTPDDAAEALAREGFHVDYVADRDGRRLAAVRLGE